MIFFCPEMCKTPAENDAKKSTIRPDIEIHDPGKKSTMRFWVSKKTKYLSLSLLLTLIGLSIATCRLSDPYRETEAGPDSRMGGSGGGGVVKAAAGTWRLERPRSTEGAGAHRLSDTSGNCQRPLENRALQLVNRSHNTTAQLWWTKQSAHAVISKTWITAQNWTKRIKK